ncbi:addiction module protein [Aequorivita echinoideorum]|uniref:Addiction module protein n=1 Tax=Aequorivita echinoideorum TaxID=1549647 RepID=A0ABS5S8W5_9FLAO|nr:addiction module protein [Aequorivita echinoideorum]MBT0608320.1 addiction module protein [Aequorivita echinoideorum]
MKLEAEKIELIQMLLNSDNKNVLEQIKQLLTGNQNHEISQAHKKELDNRLKANNEGKLNFYSIDEYENRLNEPE